MAIVATAKSESANSYVTLAESNTYLTGHPNESDWDALSDNEKEFALKDACKRMQKIPWVGERTDDDQALAWPREDVYFFDDGSDSEMDEDTVPEDIKEAQCELALWVSQSPDELDGFESFSLKYITVKSGSGNAASKAPRRFRLLIQPYLTTQSTVVVPVKRS